MSCKIIQFFFLSCLYNILYNGIFELYRTFILSLFLLYIGRCHTCVRLVQQSGFRMVNTKSVKANNSEDTLLHFPPASARHSQVTIITRPVLLSIEHFTSYLTSQLEARTLYGRAHGATIIYKNPSHINRCKRTDNMTSIAGP